MRENGKEIDRLIDTGERDRERERERERERMREAVTVEEE